MKKRRTLIISLLLVAAIALGIGYASHTADITIGGMVNVDPNPTDFSVVFVSDSATTSDQNLGTATITTTNTANFSIGKVEGATDWMSASGDTVTFTYDIINQSKDAQLEAYLNELVITAGVCRNSTTSTDVTVTDYFQVDKKVYKVNEDGNQGAEMNTGDALKQNEKARIVITVKLIKSLEDGALTWTGVSYKLPFTSVAPTTSGN